jgi:hypothetical protein
MPNAISRPSRVALRLRGGGRLLAAAAVVLVCAAAVRPVPQEIAGVVRRLYADHFAHEQRWPQTYERQRALFAPELAALLDADMRAAAANPNEIVGLDFDPLTDAQDDRERYEVGEAVANRGMTDAVVPVTFRDEGENSAVRIELTRSDEAWRISNIRYEHGDLVSILRRLAADRRRGE